MFFLSRENLKKWHSKSKLLLNKSPVVQPFDINKDSTLVCDASEKSIGGVILQESHPILYITIVLIKSEQSAFSTLSQ